MAPPPPLSSENTSYKAPPTGPKALRGYANGSNPPNGNYSSASSSTSSTLLRHEKISFGIPTPKGQSNMPISPVASRFGINALDARSNGFTGSKVPPTGPRSAGSSSRDHSSSESSRYMSSSSLARDTAKPISSGLSRPNSPPPSSNREGSRSYSRRSDYDSYSRSDSRQSVSPRRQRYPSDRSDDEEMSSFRAKVSIDTKRAPISFALPSTNGKARALPPHLAGREDSRRTGSSESLVNRSRSRFEDVPPPPPPPDLPPSPPPPSPPRARTPPGPPPPLDEPPPPPKGSLPPSPPLDRHRRDSSPRRRISTPPLPSLFKPIPISSSLPLKPLARPKSPLHPPPSVMVATSDKEIADRSAGGPSLPRLSDFVPERPIDRAERDSALIGPSFAPIVPPSFHFRDLSATARALNDGEDGEQEAVEEVEEDQEEIRVHVSTDTTGKSSLPRPGDTKQSQQTTRRRTPPPQPPKWSRPEYQPPPSVLRRPGLGNYFVISDIKASTGNIIKRFDGEVNGEVCIPIDPRKGSGDVKKGRGTAKNRDTFHEVEYQWNEHSAGVRPPPLPAAVLITKLDPLTTVDQISKFLRPHGRIREIDAKMDSKSGMQLGICWVKFDGPPVGKQGTANDVALQVMKACDGQRIGLSGTEKIRIVLDGRGLRAAKAVKEEMARRYPPKKPAPPPPPPMQQPKASLPTPSSGSGTPDIRAPAQPPVSRAIPTGPANPTVPQPRNVHSSLPMRPGSFAGPSKATHPHLSGNRQFASRTPLPSIPVRQANLPPRPVAPKAIDSSFIESPFDRRSSRYDYFRDSRDHYTTRRYRSRTRSRSRSRSRTREWSHPESCSTCQDSDDERRDYRRGRSPSPDRLARNHDRSAVENDRREEEEAVERVKKATEANGHGYVFIDKTVLPASSENGQLKEHFRAFRPVDMLSNHLGWYILFDDDMSASKAKVLDGSSFNRHRLVIQVRHPTTKKVDGTASATLDAKASKERSWKLLTITKKNRPAVPKAVKPVKAPLPVRRGRRYSFSSSSSEDEVQVQPARPRPNSLSPASSDDDDTPLVQRPKATAQASEKASTGDTLSNQIGFDEPRLPTRGIVDDAAQPGKKRPGKPKTSKKVKKAKIDSDEVIDIPAPVEPDVAEIKLDAEAAAVQRTDKPVKEPKVAKVVKAKKTTKSELDKFLETGVVEDEEDAYWLGQALAATHEAIEPDLSDLESDAEDAVAVSHPLFHEAGSWRAKGWKKVPVTSKAEYLPERNRAVVSSEKESGGHASGRTARVTGRRLAHDMETTRKTATTNTAESETLAFNQLSMRKKALRFSRSPIEGYGLYAMETINPGEMVCEYVGEICRSAVAEIREQRYLKQGIGSSYLFRIDNDMVCDATFKGSVSRLINHSCDPSASAKIISINGQSKIVIYAKRMLHPGQEILYDYKFPLESDPALRVPCLCGSASCRGWLN